MARANADKTEFDRATAGVKAAADEAGFNKLAAQLKRLCGINLPYNEKNIALVSGRLRRLFLQFGSMSYRQLAERLESDAEPELVKMFICSLTTNTTQFFRESAHFDLLRGMLPRVMAEKRKLGINQLRIWCAASSTGQEPYTLLMTINETLGDLSTDVKFLATDIDLKVLTAAREGIYGTEALRDIPPQLAAKYFQRVEEKGKNALQVKSQYREMIHFAQMNLIEFPYPFQHKFDIVFCRNVLIYFDRDTVQSVVNAMADNIAPGGYLFVGHSEALSHGVRDMQRCDAAVYSKAPRGIVQRMKPAPRGA